MWAIRKASVRIKSQLFSPVIFRASYAKIETASSSYTDNTGFSELPPHISDTSLTLKRFYSQPHVSQSSFVEKHSFFSQAGTKCRGEEDADFVDGFSELDDTSDLAQEKNMGHDSGTELISEADLSKSEDEDYDVAVGVPQDNRGLSDTEEEAMEYNPQGRRECSGLFKAIVDSSSMSVKEVLDNWLKEGNDLSRWTVSLAMSVFRKRRMYSEAFQLSEWLEAQEKVEFGERDYARHVDLFAKVWGLQKAENYIKNKIPESFKREAVYEALLANCVHDFNRKKAEQVFNKIQNLKLPITTFACNQLLLLYKKTDRSKIVKVLLLMEEENIKPSSFTYRLLIDIKGESNDLAGMEQLVERMKEDGLKPTLRLQAVLARHYVNLGVKEKAKAVLKEMEGNDLNEKWWVCSSLLPIYALLGSEYDVKRVWETRKSDPSIQECMNAIYAFGKLKKVEEAEAVFDKISKKLKRLSAKHYTAILKVYTYNKMWTKGKNLVKRMDESGCEIGPVSLDVVVKFYLEAGEIEKAASILNTGSPQKKGKPLFATYMMILGEYGERGDVGNAEKIFVKMRRDYVVRHGPYNSLLQAYINAKIPPYEFRKRLEADGVFPTKFMEDRLAQLDAFKVVMTTHQCGF